MQCLKAVNADFYSTTILIIYTLLTPRQTQGVSLPPPTRPSSLAQSFSRFCTLATADVSIVFVARSLSFLYWTENFLRLLQ